MRLLLLLTMMATSLAGNSYVVLAPSWIRANMDYTISVNILQASSPVSVTASLMLNSNAVVTESGSFQRGTPGTVSLKIPSDLQSGSYYLKVTGTGGLTFSKSEKLQVNSKELAVFIQTDKAIYKPGDAVNLRVLAVYSDLTVFSGTLDFSIKDADGNVIKRWLDKAPDNGVVTERLALSSRPVLGDWNITVTALENEGSKSFAVAEYVLPKFEVEIEAPTYVIKQDSTLDLKVKATYTYGSPVKGTVNVHVTVLDADSTYTQDGSGVLVTDAPIDGLYEISVRLDDTADPNSGSGNKKVFIIANVTESFTGSIVSRNTTVKIYGDRFNLEFPKSNVKTFRPGLRYTAYLKLTLPGGQPLEGTTDKVKITTIVTSNNRWTRTLQVTEQRVPDHGLILVSRNMPSDVKSVTIKAEFRGRSATLLLEKSQSPSNSYIQLYGLQNQGNLIVIVSSTQPMGTLVYQVITRGNIVDFGTIDAAGSTFHQFVISTTSFMSPTARIVVYYVRDDGEVVADAISFDVDGMFTNVVSVNVNNTNTRPYDPIKVTVEADPSSVAYLLAIDQSVLNKKSGNDIAKLDVFDEIKKFDVAEKLTHDLWPSDAFSWPYPIYYGGEDTEDFFKGAGIIAITGATVYSHVSSSPAKIVEAEGIPLFSVFLKSGSVGGLDSGFEPQAVAPVAPVTPAPEKANQRVGITEPASYEEPERVRVHFPEAWLWEQLTIGPQGSASLTTQVPDTITSWVVSAFAVNKVSGFGLAPVTRIKTFQPFFIRLNLPYSVVRHERVQVNTIVFNYLDQNLLIKVTLSRSDDFDIIETSSDGNETLIPEDAEELSWVAAASIVPVNFMIVPRTLGKVDINVTVQAETVADAVSRELLVKAEGVPGELNYPIYVDLGDSQGLFETTVDINLPQGIVQGSELFQISVYGDILGPSIAGLDTLLKLPTGCGEQTIVKIIPNVVVLKYLEAVSGLTDEVRNKAVTNIEYGYQNELTFRLVDGSFSVFGKQPGSMSLTAYVIRVFSQASSYITVDTNVIITGIFWMISKQRSDGSFPEPGKSFLRSEYLYTPQNPQDKETVMTLLVLLSLLENENWINSLTTTQRNNFEQAKERALSYVEATASQSDDLFILAVASYVFQLTESSQVTDILNKLEQSAVTDGDRKYWQTSSGTRVTALDIETTSYVLLTYALRRDLASGFMVEKWLIQQRNPRGGFISTQDTVVALNALSEFARLTRGDLNLDITVQLDSAATHQFSVTPDNTFSRSEDITTIPTQVTISARGQGVAIVDLAAFYNLLEVGGETTFELNTTIKDYIIWVELEACTRWLGEGPASNMAIMEVGIFTGFTVDSNSITQLETLELIEYEDKKVILYFDEIGTNSVCVGLTFNQVSLVKHLQPAAVKVYDFYDPGNQVTVFYRRLDPYGQGP